MTRRTRILLALVGTLSMSANVCLAGPSASTRVRYSPALPDWTGLWETETSAALISGELERDARAAISSERAHSDGLDPLEREFLRRTELLAPPPYTARWKEASQAARTPAGPPPPVKVCRYGFPFVMDQPTPDGTFEILITPEETLMAFPNGEMRHVYTDGRSHPGPTDLWPTAMGDSVGHWEGETLIVDTVARRPGPITPVPVPGVADLSANAHFLERIRRLDVDTLEDEMRIDDPERLAHPWTVRIRYRRVVGLDRMIATDCTESDRNPIVNGRVIISAP